MEWHVNAPEWHGGGTAFELDGLGLGFSGAGALVQCVQDAGANILDGVIALEKSLEVGLTALDLADQGGEGVEGAELSG